MIPSAGRIWSALISTNVASRGRRRWPPPATELAAQAEATCWGIWGWNMNIE
jgi:hypothetical protein